MLVQNSVYRNTYLTDGVNKDFYFSFPILESSQVLVQTSLLTSTDVTTTVDPSQYTVTGVGLTTGGHISFNTAPPTGSRIALTLNIPITQLYQYAELDSFPAKSHEDALAKLTLICQQLKEQISRAVLISTTSEGSTADFIARLYAARDSATASAVSAAGSASSAAQAASAATTAAAAFTPATTTARGIGRVATGADMVDGATITNGPAFLAAGSSDAVAWAKYAAHDVGDLTASLATSKAFYLLCNGGAYSRTTYAALFALLGTSFGSGDGSTTFNVPDFRGRTIQGANANLMSVLAAGLPNITSTANSLFLAGEISPTVSGAFTKSRKNTGVSNSTGTASGSNIEYIGFDASRGGTDPIYGKSTTVQSPAIATNIFIKF